MRLRRRAEPAKPAAAPAKRTVSSRLLPELLTPENWQGDKLNVLDLSIGTGPTVDFFVNLEVPTRLIFADCQSLAEALTRQPDAEPQDFLEILDAVRNHFCLPQNFSIDLLLIWDCLHFFDLKGVEAISTLLQPCIHADTLGYGFGSLHNDAKMTGAQYALTADVEVLITPQESKLRHPHSQQAMAEYFLCMKIGRGTLLQEGLLELQLTA